MSNRITVLSVDDHPLMREGIASALAGADDIEMVGDASNGAEAIEKFRRLRPDVTLMDIQMPGLDGIETLGEIRKEFPDARIVMLAASRGDMKARRAIKAGAWSYLFKSSLLKELRDTIRTVHGGKRYIPAEVASELAAAMLGEGSEGLSDGEVEVLRLVSAGSTNKVIARALGLPEETVKSRMKSILVKLSARDRTHAVMIALQRGIIDLY